jgi:hypothetical protein
MPVAVEFMREELGIPPRRPSVARRIALTILGITAVALGAVLGGYLIGGQYYNVRLTEFSLQAHKALAASGNATAFSEELAKAQEMRSAISGSPTARIMMAEVYLAAAGVLPNSRANLLQAESELNLALAGSSPELESARYRYEIARLQSQIFLDLSRPLTAMSAFERMRAAARELEHNRQKGDRDDRSGYEALNFNNNLAYLLASSPDPKVRDPQRAVELAESVVKSDTLLPGGVYPSSVAAYLDTLAEAYFASNKPRQALAVQETALSLAETTGLSTYIEHYDKYRAAAGKQQSSK